MKSFKYIIKRILIGTGIALLLGLIRGTLFANVYAKEIGSIYGPFQSSNINVVSNLDSESVFNINSGYFANWGLSIVRFNFSVIKVSGDPTAPVVVPSGVSIGNYVCDVSSTSIGNSTFTGATFSAVCPANISSSGLGNIVIYLSPNQQNTSSTYRIQIGMLITVETNAEISLDTSGTTNAVNNQTTTITNNQNSNTQSIISNNNSNTQSIINNQNNNTQQQIESQKVCNSIIIDKDSVVDNGKFLNNDGTFGDSANYGITDYISVGINSTLQVLTPYGASNRFICFYTSSKSLISCSALSSFSQNSFITLPSGTFYLRSSIQTSVNKPIFELKKCQNGNQAIADSQQEINNTLNNDDVTGASSEASSFFDDFQSDAHGLSGIITAPLRLIQSLSTSSCSSLTIPLPFVNTNASLPCMSTIYSTYFPTFLSLYQLITTGLIGYWVLIKIFGHVKGMQDPKDDRIEVLDL